MKRKAKSNETAQSLVGYSESCVGVCDINLRQSGKFRMVTGITHHCGTKAEISQIKNQLDYCKHASRQYKEQLRTASKELKFFDKELSKLQKRLDALK